MPARLSSGLLLYRRSAGIEVLLFHRAGSAFAARAAGAWTIPVTALYPPAPRAPVTSADGSFRPRAQSPKPRLTAAALQDALREHARGELAALTGLTAPAECAALGGVKMHGHRIVYVWAGEDRSGTEPILACPAQTGSALPAPARYDRAVYHGLEAARRLIEPQQRRFLDQLEGMLTT